MDSVLVPPNRRRDLRLKTARADKKWSPRWDIRHVDTAKGGAVPADEWEETIDRKKEKDNPRASVDEHHCNKSIPSAHLSSVLTVQACSTPPYEHQRAYECTTRRNVPIARHRERARRECVGVQWSGSGRLVLSFLDGRKLHGEALITRRDS